MKNFCFLIFTLQIVALIALFFHNRDQFANLSQSVTELKRNSEELHTLRREIFSLREKTDWEKRLLHPSSSMVRSEIEFFKESPTFLKIQKVFLGDQPLYEASFFKPGIWQNFEISLPQTGVRGKMERETPSGTIRVQKWLLGVPVSDASYQGSSFPPMGGRDEFINIFDGGEGDHRNWLKEGITNEFNSQGKRIRSTPFLGGKKYGAERNFFETGELFETREFIVENSEPQMITRYFIQGEVHFIEELNQNGEISSGTYWSKTGEILGQLRGGSGIKFVLNSLTEKPLFKGTYAKFLLNGPCENFYPHGGLKSQTFYKEGKRSGLEISFFSDGKEASRVEWLNGIPVVSEAKEGK